MRRPCSLQQGRVSISGVGSSHQSEPMTGGVSQVQSVPEKGELVTIGMPVRNGEEAVGDALASLLGQTYGNFELIISDNASTDRTGDICKEYERQDRRVRYSRNEQDIGLINNFNRVLGMARGGLFMWAAYDDLWEPEFVECLVEALRDQPDAVLAFSQQDYVNRSTGEKRGSRSLLPFSEPQDAFRRSIRFLLNGRCKGNMLLGVIRRQALEEVGGWYNGVNRRGKEWTCCDNHTLFRLASGGRFCIVDRLLFHKGFRPSFQERLSRFPRDGEPDLSYRGYLEDITTSDLKEVEKTVLRVAAFVNHLKERVETVYCKVRLFKELWLEYK